MGETKTEREKTAYVVLQCVSEGPTWKPLKTVDASNAEAAIRKLLDAQDAREGGTYVAVPARSWKPVTVTAETRTVLKLS